MLPLTKMLKEKVNTLPKGAVFLCDAEENIRQRKLLKRVEETFREQGHEVRSLTSPIRDFSEHSRAFPADPA
jgi:hypothetical protein